MTIAIQLYLSTRLGLPNVSKQSAEPVIMHRGSLLSKPNLWKEFKKQVDAGIENIDWKKVAKKMPGRSHSECQKYYNNLKITKTWQQFTNKTCTPLILSAEAEKIVIEGVENQRKTGKKISWVAIAKQIKRATREKFHPSQLKGKYSALNPAYNKGLWDASELAMLEESRSLPIPEIQKKIGTRSQNQIRNKLRAMECAPADWSPKKDARLLEIFDKCAGNLKEIYKQYPDHMQRQIAYRIGILKKISDEELFKAFNLTTESPETYSDDEILSPVAAESARLESEDEEPSSKEWTETQDELLILGALLHGEDFEKISQEILPRERAAKECSVRYDALKGSPLFERVSAEYAT